MTKRTIETAKKINPLIAYNAETDELSLGPILITSNPYTGKRYRIGRSWGSGFAGKLCYADSISSAVAIAEKMNEF